MEERFRLRVVVGAPRPGIVALARCIVDYYALAGHPPFATGVGAPGAALAAVLRRYDAVRVHVKWVDLWELDLRSGIYTGHPQELVPPPFRGGWSRDLVQAVDAGGALLHALSSVNAAVFPSSWCTATIPSAPAADYPCPVAPAELLDALRRFRDLMGSGRTYGASWSPPPPDQASVEAFLRRLPPRAEHPPAAPRA